jgi:hypothetical protein
VGRHTAVDGVDVGVFAHNFDAVSPCYSDRKINLMLLVDFRLFSRPDKCRVSAIGKEVIAPGRWPDGNCCVPLSAAAEQGRVARGTRRPMADVYRPVDILR